MLQSYLPVIVFVGLGIAVGGAFSVLNRILGPSRPNPVKSEAYECGLPSDIQRTFRFGISFYMVAMLFILFDIEVVFLYPWAVKQKSLGLFGLAEMFVFLAVLTLGWWYVLKKGALDWSPTRPGAEHGADPR